MSNNGRKRTVRTSTTSVVVALCGLALSGAAHAQEQGCGDLANAFGPFDYNDPTATIQQQGRGETPLHLVERAHFTPEVENLIRGASSTNAIDDLDYTLRVFPNHPRALYSMSKYYLRHSPSGAKLGRYTIDCWFERAMRFRPRDGVVPAIYGVYLAKKGDREQALVQYKNALELVPDFAEAHYNIALLYADMKRYDLANEHAQEAYNLGFPLPGLRKRLQDLGVWKPIATESPAASEARAATQ